jgi:hypothetical protein
VLSWRQLGLADKLEIGPKALATVAVPKPQGLAPTLISGEVLSPAGATGRIDVLDSRGSTLGNIALTGDGVTVPFTVDIAAAASLPGPLKLSFVQRGPHAR